MSVDNIPGANLLLDRLGTTQYSEIGEGWWARGWGFINEIYSVDPRYAFTARYWTSFAYFNPNDQLTGAAFAEDSIQLAIVSIEFDQIGYFCHKQYAVSIPAAAWLFG